MYKMQKSEQSKLTYFKQNKSKQTNKQKQEIKNKQNIHTQSQQVRDRIAAVIYAAA